MMDEDGIIRIGKDLEISTTTGMLVYIKSNFDEAQVSICTFDIPALIEALQVIKPVADARHEAFINESTR